MVKAGDVIKLSEFEWIKFIRTSVETNGELLELRVSYQPYSEPPPTHYHPYQDEYFKIVNGTFQVTINGEQKVYHTGDSFTIPAGINHTMFNLSEDRGELLWQIKPALRTEDFFEMIWSANRHARENNSNVNFLQMAVILRKYQKEFRLSRPPFMIQRFLIGLLSLVGRFRGYKTE